MNLFPLLAILGVQSPNPLLSEDGLMVAWDSFNVRQVAPSWRRIEGERVTFSSSMGPKGVVGTVSQNLVKRPTSYAANSSAAWSSTRWGVSFHYANENRMTFVGVVNPVIRGQNPNKGIYVPFYPDSTKLRFVSQGTLRVVGVQAVTSSKPGSDPLRVTSTLVEVFEVSPELGKVKRLGRFSVPGAVSDYDEVGYWTEERDHPTFVGFQSGKRINAEKPTAYRLGLGFYAEPRGTRVVNLLTGKEKLVKDFLVWLVSPSANKMIDREYKVLDVPKV